MLKQTVISQQITGNKSFFIFVVLERFPDDENGKLLLESIDPIILERRKGAGGAKKKKSNRVGTCICLHAQDFFKGPERSCRDLNSNIPRGRSFKDFHPGKNHRRNAGCFTCFQSTCLFKGTQSAGTHVHWIPFHS